MSTDIDRAGKDRSRAEKALEQVAAGGYDRHTWFVADSFSFGVEREMKESGEKVRLQTPWRAALTRLP